jgi:hypothetical protein
MKLFTIKFIISVLSKSAQQKNINRLQNLYVGFLVFFGFFTLIAFQNCSQAYKLDVVDQASKTNSSNETPLGNSGPIIANEGNAKLSLSPTSSSITVQQGDKLSSMHSLKVIKTGAGQAYLRRLYKATVDTEAITSDNKTINIDLSNIDTSKVGSFQKDFLFQSGDNDSLKYTLNVTVQSKTNSTKGDCVSAPSLVNLEYEVGQSKPFTVNFSMLKDASGKLKCPAGVSVVRLNVSNSSVAGIQYAPLLKNSGVAVGFAGENLCYKDANNKYCKTDFAENFDAVGSQKVGEYDWFTMNYSISPATDANGKNVDTGVKSQVVRVVVHVKANAPKESNLTNGTVLGYSVCSPQETSNDLGNRAEGVTKAYRFFSQVAGGWSNCQIQECAEGYYYDRPTNPPGAIVSCKKVKDTCDIPAGVTYNWLGGLFPSDAGSDGKMCHAITTQAVSLTMDDGSIRLSDPLDTTQPLKYDLSGTYDLVCKSKNVEVIKGFEYSAQGQLTNIIKYTLKFPEIVPVSDLHGISTETCKKRLATCDDNEPLPLSNAKQFLSIDNDPVGFILGNIPLPNILLDKHFVRGGSVPDIMSSYSKFYLNKINYLSDPKTVESYNNIRFSLEYECDGKTGKKIPKKLTYTANHLSIRSFSDSACTNKISNSNLAAHWASGNGIDSCASVDPNNLNESVACAANQAKLNAICTSFSGPSSTTTTLTRSTTTTTTTRPQVASASCGSITVDGSGLNPGVDSKNIASACSGGSSLVTNSMGYSKQSNSWVWQCGGSGYTTVACSAPLHKAVCNNAYTGGLTDGQTGGCSSGYVFSYYNSQTDAYDHWYCANSGSDSDRHFELSTSCSRLKLCSYYNTPDKSHYNEYRKLINCVNSDGTFKTTDDQTKNIWCSDNSVDYHIKNSSTGFCTK